MLKTLDKERIVLGIWKLTARAVNFALFYFGWGICLAGARTGRPLEGPIVVGVITSLHLFFVKNKVKELILLITLAFWGLFNDSLYLNFGIIQYHAPSTFMPNLVPPWVVSIWILFGTSVNHSMSWMRNRWKFASFIGACGGSFSYYVGSKVGAITFLHPEIHVLLMIAISWAVILPLSLWYGKWLEQKISNHTKNN